MDQLGDNRRWAGGGKVSEKRARKEMKSVVEVRLPAPLNRVSRREVQALQLQLQLQLHASKCCSMDVVLPVRGVRCSAEGGSEQPFQVRSVLRTHHHHQPAVVPYLRA